MRILFITLLFLVVCVPANSRPIPINAVGSLEKGGTDSCAAWAVRPRLLITASHCVWGIGSVHIATYYRGVAKVQLNATVIWDSVFYEKDPTLDLALLRIEKQWPIVLPLASMLPRRGSTLETLSFALSARRWAGTAIVEGLYELEGFGWMLMTRSDYDAGGASGSPLTFRDKVVGMHTIGYPPLRLSGAIPVGRIRRALLDLDVYGPMQDRPE